MKRLQIPRRSVTGGFRGYVLMELARLSVMSDDLDKARSRLDEARDISVEIDPRFIGARIAGVMAFAARDPAARAAALAEGQDILRRGCIAHNHFWFYRDAIDASLIGKDWAEALRYAAAMEDFTAEEPLPWAEF